MTGIGQIVLLIFYCLQSTAGPNRFGPAPDGSTTVNAASGAYTAPEGPNAAHDQTTPASAPVAASGGTIEQLEKLSALHSQGAIDDAEFTRMKAGLLNKSN